MARAFAALMCIALLLLCTAIGPSAAHLDLAVERIARVCRWEIGASWRRPIARVRMELGSRSGALFGSRVPPLNFFR